MRQKGKIAFHRVFYMKPESIFGDRVGEMLALHGECFLNLC